MKYLYLHGLGQKPDSWNRVIKETKVSESSVKLSLAEMLEGKSATYKELYSAFHLMPNSAFGKMGFKKADVISLCRTMAELDFSDSLNKVSCPVLLICGEKDTANKKTSKELCQYLNNACFHELAKTGHEANIEAPEELAIVLQRFYDNIR